MPIKRTTSQAKRESMNDELTQENTTEAPMEKKKNSGVIFSAIIILVVLLTAAVLGLKQLTQKGAKEQPKQFVQTQGPAVDAPATQGIDDLISKVKQHIAVKQDEIPTVYTIQDADAMRVQNQDFYREAANGDRLLVWSDKAVLYSTMQDIILSVLPITLIPAEGQASSTAAGEVQAVSEKATIEIRNGSGKSGLAKTTTENLTGLGLTTLAPTDAARRDYATTLIIKNNDASFPQTQQALLGAFGLSEVTSSLPSDERTSTADFIVILGRDAIK